MYPQCIQHEKLLCPPNPILNFNDVVVLARCICKVSPPPPLSPSLSRFLSSSLYRPPVSPFLWITLDLEIVIFTKRLQCFGSCLVSWSSLLLVVVVPMVRSPVKRMLMLLISTWSSSSPFGVLFITATTAPAPSCIG